MGKRLFEFAKELGLTSKDVLERCKKLGHNIPSQLTVVDEKTVYLRLPQGFLESDTLLMVLRNLMKAAWEREKNGAVAPAGANQKSPALSRS